MREHRVSFNSTPILHHWTAPFQLEIRYFLKLCDGALDSVSGVEHASLDLSMLLRTLSHERHENIHLGEH